MSFPEFLTYAQGPGINLIIGFVLSFVVEWYPSWGNLPPRVKRIAMGFLSLVVPIAAAALSVAMGYQDSSFESTFWPAIVAGFTAFTGSQAGHLRSL